jgi:hypothetical protein
MIKTASAGLGTSSRALGLAAALSYWLMATAVHADMQGGTVPLGGNKLSADIQYKGLPGAP